MAVDKKRACFLRWKSSGLDADRQAYLASKKASARCVWEAQESKVRELAEQLDVGSRNQFFRIAKQMAKEAQDACGATCVKDENGNIAADQEEVKNIWRRYFERLMNTEYEWDGVVESDLVEGPRPRIAKDEVSESLKRAKAGKAAGPSGVAVEMIQASGEFGDQWLTDLFNAILDEGRIPTDWMNSILVPLFKGKGDPLVCGSYRAIKLLEQAMKVWERVLEARLRSQAKVDDMQFGFMPGKGTTDAIFIVRQMQEKHAKRKKLYLGFVDLEKAFDRVPREVVRWALRRRGVEEWLVEAIMMLYVGARTVVRTCAGDSASFEVNVGVHQGSVLSPLLFAIVMDVVTEEARGGLPWEILYADDLVIMADSREQLADKMAAWRNCMSGKGLKVNAEKTKVMACRVSSEQVTETGASPCGVCRKGVGANSIHCTSCRKWVHRRCSGVQGSLLTVSATFTCRRCRGLIPEREVEENLVVGGDTYEVVDTFCYLGDTLGSGGGVDAAVTARVRRGWQKFKELLPFLTSKAPSLKMKGKVYKACVRSGMLYGCETWATRADHVKKMETTEMRMIRWMCGASLADRQTNDTLRRRTGIEPVGVVMMRSRLRWFGHVERKEGTDWVKKCREVVVEGRAPVGRPRKTWQETVNEDMRQLGLTAADAQDRSKWRSSIRRAQANPGLAGQRP